MDWLDNPVLCTDTHNIGAAVGETKWGNQAGVWGKEGFLDRTILSARYKLMTWDQASDMENNSSYSWAAWCPVVL